MSVILHIGASKCGSSAIQTALTQNPLQRRRDGSLVEYIAIDKRGKLVRGNALKERAGVRGYMASAEAKNLVELKSDMDDMETAFHRIPHDVLLSSEGWIYQNSQWSTLLERLDAQVRVIVYLRPQVPLLNSAWWQWGAWSDEPFEKWMERRLNASLWYTRLSKWKEISRVSSIQVRLVHDDVVRDLYDVVLDVDPKNDHTSSINKGLPAPFLRLFQRNRELRTTPHASKIDFIISKYLKPAGSAPWVLDSRWVEHIVKACASDNKALLTMLDPGTAKKMEADARWWDASLYAEMPVESPDPQPLPLDVLEQMCVELLKVLQNLH